MATSYKQLLSILKKEKVETWFDLGLFLDQLKEKKSVAGINGDFFQFKEKLVKGSVGFLSFYFGIDGITVETAKYISVIKRIIPGVEIHVIAGKIGNEVSSIFSKDIKEFEISEIRSFDDWELYHYFFKTKLERGSKEYNLLIKNFWEEVLLLTEKLAKYIETNKIKLLYTLNVNSNPGNVSLALAVVLVTEHMGIPVINNCHDYYWEDGNKLADIKKRKLKPGFRDFFFTNSDVGEIFSPIDVLFPWESRSWITVNINRIQEKHIIETKGHNPSNVSILGTSVNSNRFEPVSKRESINTLRQVGEIFQNNVVGIKTVLKNKTIYANKPFLTGLSTKNKFNFVKNNIVFFQPTRIINRKRVEINFILVKKLFLNKSFVQKFIENSLLKLTIIVSGPIAGGHIDYFYEVLNLFNKLLSDLPIEYRGKVFLGFLFSAFDKDEYKEKSNKLITIPDLYAAASLILLPSETEGRGLPIIESAAAGKPIFVRRYEPEEVYAEVKGEHLDESLRLKVLEFKDNISEKLVQSMVTKIFYPQDSLRDVIHNKNVIQKRFNIDSLQKNLNKILYQIYLQLKSINQSKEKIAGYIKEYDNYQNKNSNELDYLIDRKRREYLPGYRRLSFMIMLKSLIDPSFFRVEEQLIKGEIYYYAKNLFDANDSSLKLKQEKYQEFFNAIDEVFNYYEGEFDIRHDHSFAYRHRNKKYYPYQSYTYQELTGLINLIFDDIIDPQKQEPHILSSDFFFTDWNLALVQLTGSHYLGIDNRDILFIKLKQPVPRVYYPGRYIKFEMELFVLQPIRAIIKLGLEEELTEKKLKENINSIPKVYLFINKYHLYNPFFFNEVKYYLESTYDREVSLLYKYGVIQIVKTPQYCVGFHLYQLGDKGLKILREVKNKKGFIISNGQSSAMMTDILEIDCFHIGKIKKELISKIMGIPIGSGFIQFVPAAVRTTIAYPTPIQTSKDFERAIKSKRFKNIADRIGEEKLFNLISEDAKTKGTPIADLLKKIESNMSIKKKQSFIETNYVSGVYNDSMPWSGVLAEVDINSTKTKWNFTAHISINDPKPVTEQAVDFYNATGKKPNIAWNGGYILNPELVGKLGLSEAYIGSPLGLLIIDKKIVCPPLFNKPAFIVYKNGRLDIKHVNSSNGLKIIKGKESIIFKKEFYNKHSVKLPCYYDLNNDFDEIIGDGNVIIRLAGVKVKEIIFTKKNEKVKLIPVGITLSIPKKLFNKDIFIKNQSIKIDLLFNEEIELEKISYAVEAGPMLVDNRKVCINMNNEGWKRTNSIKTQAARLDFTDMRGPKIAVGLTNDGKLLVLAINGRIRESVGATHKDMADILISYGVKKAMGFDPGGSTTLVVEKKQLNISPYNKNYEEDIYSLPPEARFVASSIFGWHEPV